jgi:hypothetical protein
MTYIYVNILVWAANTYPIMFGFIWVVAPCTLYVFTVHLTRLSVTQKIYSRMIEWSISNELRGMWNEGMGCNLILCSDIFLERLRNCSKNIRREHSLSPVRDLNLGLPEMKQERGSMTTSLLVGCPYRKLLPPASLKKTRQQKDTIWNFTAVRTPDLIHVSGSWREPLWTPAAAAAAAVVLSSLWS